MLIDTLRFFDPEFESANTIAVNRLKHIRKAMDQFGFSTLLIHHPKKDDEARPRTPLNEVTHPVMAWMQCLSGAQALTTDGRATRDRPRS
jgi:hypothetical protein